MGPRKMFAVSGRAPKGLINGDSELERETAAGELGNAKPMTKS